jgi:diguanylate cyclase (GGDEF)-like protein
VIARLLLAVLLAIPGALAASEGEPLRLDGGWRWQPGDSATWAAPAHPDARWALVEAPAEWERFAPGYDGFGWYRREVRLPAGLAEGPVGVQLGTVGDAFEIFWNGVRVGGSGRMPPRFVEGVAPTLLLVPDSALARRPGGPHLVAVRVYNAYGYGGLMGGVRVGRYDLLAQRRSPRDVVIGGLVSFFLAIGIYHLAFFFRRRSARENLYFALLCAAVSVYGATFSGVVQALLAPHVNSFRVGLWAMAAGMPAFVALVHRLFDLRLARRDKVLTGVATAAFVLVGSLPLAALASMAKWVELTMVVGLFVVVGRACRATSASLPHGRILGVGTVSFAVAVTYDLLSENLDWVPVARVLPGVPSLFWIGFLVFVLCVGIATAGKWALAEATAQVDPLTELSRRHVLDEALRRECERVRRRGGSVALVMIDLDHFKQVNDRHGHGAGDVVLARVGRLLRSCARNIDTPARFGGEEFAVLLCDSGLEGAKALAERFRRHLAELRVPVADGATITVTASVGIAAGSDLVDPDALLEAADQALYRAKSAGRDRSCAVHLDSKKPAAHCDRYRAGNGRTLRKFRD